jgi:hypothetical protein
MPPHAATRAVIPRVSIYVKGVVLSVLKEKVATRYTYQAVDQIVNRILEDEHEPLEKFLRGALRFVTNDKKFQAAVQEEFQHKVAKAMVGKLEGAVERAVDKIRQNETLRAEMILAIGRIIEKDKITRSGRICQPLG